MGGHRTVPHIAYSAPGPEIAEAAREHTDIALAVIGHDAARAEQLMRHHVQGTLKTLKLQLEGRTD